jgi:hypothetical protein
MKMATALLFQCGLDIFIEIRLDVWTSEIILSRNGLWPAGRSLRPIASIRVRAVRV